jgi:heterodisulfide reductase subunit B
MPPLNPSISESPGLMRAAIENQKDLTNTTIPKLKGKANSSPSGARKMNKRHIVHAKRAGAAHTMANCSLVNLWPLATHQVPKGQLFQNSEVGCAPKRRRRKY